MNNNKKLYMKDLMTPVAPFSTPTKVAKVNTRAKKRQNTNTHMSTDIVNTRRKTFEQNTYTRMST